jgi:hypothetical protein
MKGAGDWFVSEHPNRVDCVFAGAEIVRQKRWRMQCHGAQRYDLYRVVVRKQDDGIERREEVFVSSYETESRCEAAVRATPPRTFKDVKEMEEWFKELKESKTPISYLQCVAIGEVIEDVSTRTRER